MNDLCITFQIENLGCYSFSVSLSSHVASSQKSRSTGTKPGALKHCHGGPPFDATLVQVSVSKHQEKEREVEPENLAQELTLAMTRETLGARNW